MSKKEKKQTLAIALSGQKTANYYISFANGIQNS
jgi:hypothetical protein